MFVRSITSLEFISLPTDDRLSKFIIRQALDNDITVSIRECDPPLPSTLDELLAPAETLSDQKPIMCKVEPDELALQARRQHKHILRSVTRMERANATLVRTCKKKRVDIIFSNVSLKRLATQPDELVNIASTFNFDLSAKEMNEALALDVY